MRDTRSSTVRRSPLALVVGALSATAAFSVVGANAAPGEDAQAQGSRDQGKAKNVILFIGDGMGVAQRNAGALATVGLDGELVMDSLPYTGLVKTDSADPTNSSPTPPPRRPLRDRSEDLQRRDRQGRRRERRPDPDRAGRGGRAVHRPGHLRRSDRRVHGCLRCARRGPVHADRIARQYVEETGVDVLLGGGEDFWYPADDPGEIEGGSSQSDQGNLVEKAQGLGYQYVSDAEGLADAEGDQLLGLFANRTMFVSELEPVGTNDRTVSLEEMTEKAVEILSENEKGFFLVVEEEAVDEQAHAANTEKTIEAVQLMDEAVAVAKQLAEQRNDTLVITTADHETGGMAVESTDPKDEGGEGLSAEDGPFAVADSDLEFMVDWTTTGHTNADVPLTAMGPGSARLTGYYENTFVYEVMRDALFPSAAAR